MMNINAINVHPLQAPGRTLVVVTVHTDDGIVGVGEAGLQRRWRAIDGAVDHLRQWLVGEDASRIEYLWQRVWRGGFYPADRVIGSALAAVDIALWDIKGQALGVPVYQLLGGRCRNFVETFGCLGYENSLSSTEMAEEQRIIECIQRDANPDDVATLAAQQAERGCKYFRLTPPTRGEYFDSRWSVTTLIAQLEKVRERVGDRLELMVDLHTRLSLEESLYFCRAVEPLRMFVVEDPVRSEDPGLYRRLREATTVPLAAGEQWASKWEFREAIVHRWIDYARVDICIAGGITETQKIAALAETHQVKLLLHNPLGPICTAASLHVDLACDNAGPQEVIFDPERLLPDVFRCAFQFTGTQLSVPTAVGIGVRFDAEAARKYPAEMTEPPHFHRPDGSFTNY